MSQYSAIREVRRPLRAVMEQGQRLELIEQLEGIDVRLKAFHDRGIDFKEVVDGLDDSIVITNAEGTVSYINPAYTCNTEIIEEDVPNRDVRSLIDKDKLFTGGAMTSVLGSGKSTFRLSTTYKTGEPLAGYTMGMLTLREDGSLRQVVARSRPAVTFSPSQEDFKAPIKGINATHPKTIITGSDKHLSEGIIGKYDSLKQIDAPLDRVASTDTSILITGEPGVGREMVADEIYRRSLRRNKPYVKVNCASIPGHLLELELFGYEKGALTGANIKGKIGLFEYINHSILMLDEISDTPMDLQVKLLRAIQSQEITRIGRTRPIKPGIRLLALTNVDLKKKVAEGSFHQDLRYQPSVIPIVMPALRQRTEGFEELCRHFIRRFTKKYDWTPCPTERQIDYMRRYQWSGSIRELENVVEYLILCSPGIGRIEDDVLKGLLSVPEENLEPQPAAPAIVKCAQEEELRELSPEDLGFNTTVAGLGKKLPEQVLKGSSNLREASRKLNISVSTVCRKIRQYGIDYEGRRS